MDYSLSIIIKCPADGSPNTQLLYHGNDPLHSLQGHDDLCTVGFTLDTYENRYGQFIVMPKEDANDETLAKAVQMVLEMALNVKKTVEKTGGLMPPPDPPKEE